MWLALITVSNILGSLLSYAIPFYMVLQYDKDNPAGSPAKTKEQDITRIFEFMLGETLCCSLLSVTVIGFWKSADYVNEVMRNKKMGRKNTNDGSKIRKVPPRENPNEKFIILATRDRLQTQSTVSGAAQKVPLSLVEQIREIFKRKYLLFIVANFGIGYGLFCGFLSVLTQLLTQQGYNEVRE